MPWLLIFTPVFAFIVLYFYVFTDFAVSIDNVLRPPVRTVGILVKAGLEPSLDSTKRVG